ncbi:MAG: winged helix-turn-helix domain-containing protein [Kordiimonas sp.]
MAYTNFQTADYTIYPRTGEVKQGALVTKVRPKTFQLLLLLIEAEGQLVDKEFILRTIWDDVNVDEQVIFQSIKELRKIFKDVEAIKTVPRKGYSWVLPVFAVEENEYKNSSNLTRNIAVGFALVLLLVSVFWGMNRKDEISGSILVLPVTSTLADKDHRWVRYGAMDLLIQRLAPSANMGVYQTSDVLEVLKRAEVTAQTATDSDIARLFAISGANMIVQTSVAGFPRDYQVHYTVHRRGSRSKGVVLADKITDALDKIASDIGQRTGVNYQIDQTVYVSEFANEMLASALELMLAEDFSSAEKFLVTAVEMEPNNVAAKRLLAQSVVVQKSYDKADNILMAAFEQAVANSNQSELVRIMFWRGVNELQAGNIEAARNFLESAAVYAVENKDWLHLGYVSEFMGHAYRFEKEYALAEEAYRSAIDYHTIIQCPYGQAQGYMNIAKLAFTQNDIPKAETNTSKSRQLVESHQLRSLQKELYAWIGTLKPSLMLPDS